MTFWDVVVLALTTYLRDIWQLLVSAGQTGVGMILPAGSILLLVTAVGILVAAGAAGLRYGYIAGRRRGKPIITMLSAVLTFGAAVVLIGLEGALASGLAFLLGLLPEANQSSAEIVYILVATANLLFYFVAVNLYPPKPDYLR